MHLNPFPQLAPRLLQDAYEKFVQQVDVLYSLADATTYTYVRFEHKTTCTVLNTLPSLNPRSFSTGEHVLDYAKSACVVCFPELRALGESVQYLNLLRQHISSFSWPEDYVFLASSIILSVSENMEHLRTTLPGGVFKAAVELAARIERICQNALAHAVSSTLPHSYVETVEPSALFVLDVFQWRKRPNALSFSPKWSEHQSVLYMLENRKDARDNLWLIESSVFTASKVFPRGCYAEVSLQGNTAALLETISTFVKDGVSFSDAVRTASVV